MHADKWAPAGSVLAILFLVEFGPVVTTADTLGLDFLFEYVILIPLLAALIGTTLWTLAYDRRYHRNPWPSRLTWTAAALVLASLWVPDVTAWIGLALVAGAAVWNGGLVGGLSERRARAREVGRKLG